MRTFKVSVSVGVVLLIIGSGLVGGCSPNLQGEAKITQQDMLVGDWIWEGSSSIEWLTLRLNGTYSRWGFYGSDMSPLADEKSVVTYYSHRNNERYYLPLEAFGHWRVSDDGQLILRRDSIIGGDDHLTETFRIERVTDKELLVRLVRVKYSYQREAHERDMLGFHFMEKGYWEEMTPEERAAYYEKCDAYYAKGDPPPVPLPVFSPVLPVPPPLESSQ